MNLLVVMMNSVCKNSLSTHKNECHCPDLTESLRTRTVDLGYKVGFIEQCVNFYKEEHQLENLFIIDEVYWQLGKCLLICNGVSYQIQRILMPIMMS